MKYYLTLLLSLIFLNDAALAQCSPSVIFKDDFGTGTAQYGPALPANVTAYQYTATGSVNDGQYSIRKTAAPLDGTQIFGSWFTGSEHTGNNGYMMVVNASFNAGKFYETKIDNLCSGTSIKFSAWIANLLRLGTPDPLDPDVKFEIKSAASGTVLGSYTTGKISRYSTFTWEQYGFDILLPPGETSVILTMYNNQVGGYGNDLVLDDIEFSVCGAETKPFLTGTYLGGNTVCSNNNILINGNITKQVYNNPVYQWQSSTDSINWVNINGANQQDYTINNATASDSKWYRLLIAEPASINLPNCRTTSSAIKLDVYDPKPVTLSNESPYCIGDTIKLVNQFPALSYNWTGPNSLSSTDSVISIFPASFSDAGVYSLTTITDGGCVTIGNTNVTIKPNKLSVSLPDTTTLLCDNATVTFTANNPFITDWQWSTGATTPSLTIATDGTYWVKVSDDACKAADTTTVRTNRTPVVNLGSDTTICTDENILLDVTDVVATDYLWQDGDNKPVKNIVNQGYYQVTLSNECGTATDGFSVIIANCLNQLFVPTAFTPNNDNKNDILKAKAFFPITDFSFSIYNRWGQKIFTTTNLFAGWDGTLNGNQAPSGAYVWYLSYKRKNVPYKQKGSTVLIR
ncbi:MAG: gliding motility-associated C-terminal domain-containing protein [Sphingobacteriales bacterium]|nr:gliding motility-associated C-terminal domain-containing protein [Sphingobacteriales bacterium]MBI3718884.1 gliding motility-associated C-terminal domain-containing protein [Sphingobacteriales bacterium]